MGAVPASGDLVIVKLLATSSAEPTINDLSFRVDNPATTWPAQVAQVVADLDACLGLLGGGLWSAGRSTAYNLFGIQVVDVLPNTSPLAEVAAAGAGDQPDDAMPPNDSLCITLRTGVKGKTGRGRLYLNGYGEGSANGGFWEAAAQDAATAIATALLTSFGEGGSNPNMRWGVISRFEFKAKREVPAFTQIDSFTVHNEVRSLRRRAVGVRISRHRAA